MPKNCRARWFAAAAALAIALAASWSWACSVPVFRYALERWEPDPYVAVLFHRGPLSAEDEAVCRRLEAAAHNPVAAANVVLQTVDLDGDVPEPWNYVRQQHADSPLPWLVVRFPLRSRIDGHVWAGPPAAADLDQLLDSPLRREMAKRLVAGQSAVWVLLDSSNQAASDAAFELLAGELPRLEKTLKLPELALQDESIVSSGPELKIGFSLLRLKRDDPQEQPLVQMLLSTEQDLKALDEPLAFPVFGRGRAHWALVGAGISQENIADLAAFLVGECSCEVKERNPGADLLMTAAWSQFGGAFVVDETLPPLVGLPPLAASTAAIPAAGALPAASAQPAAQATSHTPAATAVTEIERSPPRTLTTGILVACAALLTAVAVGTAWLRAKQANP